MNNIKKILEGVEVEWKPLGEVVKILDSKRKPISKSQRTGGEYPYYGANGIQDYIDDYIFDGTFLLLGEDGSVINENGSPILNWATGKIWVNNHAHILAEKHDIAMLRFVYFTLATIDVRKVVKGNIPKITQQDLKNFQIPIPPLSVQEEIVRILDTFSTLTAELQAELQARKSQYRYYREQLFSYSMEESDQPSLRSSQSANSIKESDSSTQQTSIQNPHTNNSALQLRGKVEWKPLGEIGELIRGNGLQKKDFTETGVGCIHYGQIYTYYGTYTYKTKSFVSTELANKLQKVNQGDVVITNTSENTEDVGKAVTYLGKKQIVTGGHATIFKPSNKIIGKYFVYFTQTEMFSSQKRRFAKGTKVIDVSATDMAKILIPVPSLAEQERIVSILDKFDTLTTSISEGLPKEIELRQKQYEYYRDLLLTFNH